jgi:hypothetical protein
MREEFNSGRSEEVMEAVRQEIEHTNSSNAEPHVDKTLNFSDDKKRS